MNDFDRELETISKAPLTADRMVTVQINVGLVCNFKCSHCHIDADGSRKELMSRETMDLLLARTRGRAGVLYDITGGSPELNPHLTYLIHALRERGDRVQVRSNLAVLNTAGQAHMAKFYRDHAVQLVASLPCYLEENVEAQRGAGSFASILTAMKKLNGLGYGVDPALTLTLVYNPGGPFLPPPQLLLEEAYRTELLTRYGVRFTRLITITNMPIGRFKEHLDAEGQTGDYRQLLRDHFNPATIDGVMCRHQVSVQWDGTLSDCDFNQALHLPMGRALPRHIEDFSWEALDSREIVTGDHCFGCTAGAGSSCSGALADGEEEPLASAS